MSNIFYFDNDENKNKGISSCFIKLYGILNSYKGEIEKSRIIETIGLDTDNLINKTIKQIDNEMHSIELMNRVIAQRSNTALESDLAFRKQLLEYYDELKNRGGNNE